MAKHGTMTITGQSGTQYAFEVFSWDTNFNDVGAVYVITKRIPKTEGGGSHTYVYVGETGDLSERFDSHHKIECFAQHGANCICVHVESGEKSRLVKESDLIAALNPPCND